MFSRLRNAIITKLKRQYFDNDDEAYRFLMSFASNIFVLAVHLVLLLLFIVFGKEISVKDVNYPNFFIYLNLFSIIVYSLVFLLIYMRKYIAFALILAIEVGLYTVLLCFLTGIETYGITYLALVIIILAKFPHECQRLKIGLIIYAILLIIISIVGSYYVDPIFEYSKFFEKVVLGVNVFIFILGMISELFVGNLLNQIIKSLSEAKIIELANQTMTDELTGLFNRRYAKKFFEECITSKKTYCIAMLDIDDFKIVNDTYGHNCGDEVLVFLAEYLTQNLRSTDVVVRWGGEEFLIIIENISLEAAHRVLDELREFLSQEIIRTKDKDIRITVTIGIAPLVGDIESTIKSCDQKMYKGKRSGKNIVII